MTVAIITGTSRGLGEAMVSLLLEAGIFTICVGRTFTEAQSQAARERRASLIECDFSQVDPTMAQKVSDAIPEGAAQLLFIANAATIQPIGLIGDPERQSIANALQTNIIGLVTLSEALVRHCRENAMKLEVINISSGAARRPIPSWSIYCASKAAADIYFDTLALETPEFLVRRVDPGVMDTGMQAQIRQTSKERFPQVSSFSALHTEGRLARPADVAASILHAYAKAPTR